MATKRSSGGKSASSSNQASSSDSPAGPSAVISQAVKVFENNIIPPLGNAYVSVSNVYNGTIVPRMSGADAQDIMHIVLGLCLALFGASFPLLIASFEAFRVYAYPGFKAALSGLYSEAAAANGGSDDSQSGENKVIEGDSAAIGKKAVTGVLATDPNKARTAMFHLVEGVVMILANLKLSVVRAITLGASLGETLYNRVMTNFGGSVKSATPERWHKWLPAIIEFLAKSIAILIAFVLQTVITAIHASISGGSMAGDALIAFANRTGKLQAVGLGKDANPQIVQNLGAGIAAFGFVFQLWAGFNVMFPFNLMFFPLSVVEWALSVVISLV